MLLGRVKKVISGLVALSMLTTFAVPSGMVKAADSSELKNPVVSKTETTWDRVVFGITIPLGTANVVSIDNATKPLITFFTLPNNIS